MRRRARITEVMDRWAYWVLHGREGGGGGRMSTVLGRVLAAMGEARCPAFFCLGDKCPRCKGTGRVQLKYVADDPRIDPSWIASTAVGVVHLEDDVAREVDGLIKHLPELWQKVVIREYMTNGTQGLKARRLRISRQHYVRVLGDSLKYIEENMKQIAY